MRISDWSSDVCSSDLIGIGLFPAVPRQARLRLAVDEAPVVHADVELLGDRQERSEEHTSELQSLMRISYAVFCLKKKTTPINRKSKNMTPKEWKTNRGTETELNELEEADGNRNTEERDRTVIT